MDLLTRIESYDDLILSRTRRKNYIKQFYQFVLSIIPTTLRFLRMKFINQILTSSMKES